MSAKTYVGNPSPLAVLENKIEAPRKHLSGVSSVSEGGVVRVYWRKNGLSYQGCYLVEAGNLQEIVNRCRELGLAVDKYIRFSNTFLHTQLK